MCIFTDRRDSMTIIGITGQSGAGKGECSKILASYGFYVIDADEVYHNIITPPSKCLDELVQSFGAGILDKDGHLDRKTLGGIVFGEENADKLSLLNRITHKHVCENIYGTLELLKSQGCSRALIDAPLLLEAELNLDCDFTISVIADKDVRIKRIMARDSIDEHAACKRIDSQRPTEFYTSRTDFTVENNGDLLTLKTQIEKILSTKEIGYGNE